MLTFALASRAASASAAIALCSCCGSLTSLISTRSTLIPHESVASSRVACSREKNCWTNCNYNWGHHCLFFSSTPAYCGRCFLCQKGPQPGSWSPGRSSRWSGPVGGWSNPHWTRLPLRQQGHLHGSTQRHPQILSLSLWSISKCKQKQKCGNLVG